MAVTEQEAGRHRRVDPALRVHLVFADGSELSLGPDSSLARAIGHLAMVLADR
jgi:hypothetical protein